jgi:hypothetical protein
MNKLARRARIEKLKNMQVKAKGKTQMFVVEKT